MSVEHCVCVLCGRWVWFRHGEMCGAVFVIQGTVCVYPTNQLSLAEGRRVLALRLVLLGLDIQAGGPLLALPTNGIRSARSGMLAGWVDGAVVVPLLWLPSSIPSIPLSG